MRTEINRLFCSISALRGDAEDVPAQQMLVLLAIGRHPGITGKELMAAVGLSQSSVSRNTMASARRGATANRA
jgi:DNA-binding MarR family transcriptional regulator